MECKDLAHFRRSKVQRIELRQGDRIHLDWVEAVLVQVPVHKYIHCVTIIVMDVPTEIGEISKQTMFSFIAKKK